jgi:hypothetical protein
MRAFDTARFAVGAATGNPLRTVLLMLAMSIGVAAVVVLTALGDGARRFVTDEFASLGTNLVIVLPGRTQTGGFSPANAITGTTRDLTVDDARARCARLRSAASRRWWSALPRSAWRPAARGAGGGHHRRVPRSCARSRWRRAGSCRRRTGTAARR